MDVRGLPSRGRQTRRRRDPGMEGGQGGGGGAREDGRGRRRGTLSRPRPHTCQECDQQRRPQNLHLPACDWSVRVSNVNQQPVGTPPTQSPAPPVPGLPSLAVAPPRICISLIRPHLPRGPSIVYLAPSLSPPISPSPGRPLPPKFHPSLPGFKFQSPCPEFHRAPTLVCKFQLRIPRPAFTF